MVAVHWNLPTCGYDELPETASPVTECDCPRSYGRAGSADLRGYQLDADQDAGRPDLGYMRADELGGTRIAGVIRGRPCPRGQAE